MNIIAKTYNSKNYHFQEDGWFNATLAAKQFNKKPNDWLRLLEINEYIQALSATYGKFPYVRTSRSRLDRGGGTWLHPKLAVVFARWLDVRFAVWCDEQISQLLYGTMTQQDWQRLRHEAASSYKVMSGVLQDKRADDNKLTEEFHYMNEAKLINWAITGQFKGINREELSTQELDVLAKLENRNSILIAKGVDYRFRKELLRALAAESRVQTLLT